MDSQESSPTPQFGSISSSALSTFYGPTLTIMDGYWKNIVLTIQTSVSKVMSLLYNALSRFKGLDLIDRMPVELQMEVSNIV